MNVTPSELVDCKVSVSPALARRMRKAKQAEQSGQDARGALMMAAGYEPNEIDRLKSHLEDMSSALLASEQAQEMTKPTVNRLTIDLTQYRKKVTETNKNLELLNATLSQSVETHGLPDKLTKNIVNLVEAIRGGEKPQTALLAAADYNIKDVDDAMSSIEPLKANITDLELTVAPLRSALASNSLKSWIIRRILSLS
jgi:predicted  nucleic acid-binding Zn-ribbon protein